MQPTPEAPGAQGCDDQVGIEEVAAWLRGNFLVMANAQAGVVLDSLSTPLCKKAKVYGSWYTISYEPQLIKGENVYFIQLIATRQVSYDGSKEVTIKPPAAAKCKRVLLIAHTGAEKLHNNELPSKDDVDSGDLYTVFPTRVIDANITDPSPMCVG